MGRERWRAIKILGYRDSEPVYASVNTDYHKTERILIDGQLLLDNGGHRLTVTVDARGYPQARVKVEGSADNKLQIKKFAGGIVAVAGKENYYRKKKIEFDGRIRFKDVCEEAWGNIDLAPAVEEQIKASTIGLLKGEKTWTKYGLPLKRCVLIRGGTDKNQEALCRVLMAEASCLTCITADANELDYGCFTELYRLARDLRPCLVFLMNIGRFSQNRIKPGCPPGKFLLSLLTILGGIEEYEGIVPVATASRENALTEAVFYRQATSETRNLKGGTICCTLRCTIRQIVV